MGKRAARIHEPIGPDSVQIEDDDLPVACNGMVLIDVHRAGVAFPDLLVSRGEYQVKPDSPFTLGSERTGVVREAPTDSGFKVVQRVAGA